MIAVPNVSWSDRLRRTALAAVGMMLILQGGCAVKRTVRLESTPPGAIVYLNGEEVARTPSEIPLRWYGRYDVAVRKEGYETLQTQRWVVAPWWQWPPMDLVAELLPVPLQDRRHLSFTLQRAHPQDEGLLNRAESLRAAMRGE